VLPAGPAFAKAIAGHPGLDAETAGFLQSVAADKVRDDDSR
jgi:hypothetical protein